MAVDRVSGERDGVTDRPCRLWRRSIDRHVGIAVVDSDRRRRTALDPVRPSGAVLQWSWVRLLTPFINMYAVFFLIGGAIRSAWRHYRERGHKYRAAGNALIAVGAILPGVGGSFAKAGMVEVLYVGECIGIMLIWIGDRVCSKEQVGTRKA